MSLYVTGDTHGDIDFSKLNSKNFPEGKDLNKNDYVLICGDFGGVWDNGRCDKYIQEWYNNKPWTTLFVDGNHENHDALDAYPVEYWNGGKVHKISDSIIHLMRGQVFNIDGNTIFTMGGATSTDRACRTEGVSWWTRELPNSEEYDEASANLEKVQKKVDYVFTHCSPLSHTPLSNYVLVDELNIWLDMIANDMEFKGWYYGHYHVNEDDDKFHALYGKIEKLW